MVQKLTAKRLRRRALHRAIEWNAELIDAHTPDPIDVKYDSNYKPDPDFEKWIAQWKYEIAAWRKMLDRSE
ncbi:MAG: hypothetical protein ABUJ98_14770 [Hyphomicrobium sp.]